jgi:hypothetical protein
MSSSVTTKPPADQRVGTIGLATPTEDLVSVIFAACIIGGAASDGWAHSNRLSQIQQEGFFTPWHAVLYTGFAASAAWTFFLAYRRRDRAPRWWLDGWPTGYRLGAIGVVTFLFAGLADMIWHTVFGVESTIDALMSPSHILLAVGTVLLTTSAMRSWWASGEGGRRAATGIVAMALGTTSISVFLLYVSIFDFAGPTMPFDGTQNSPAYSVAARGVAAYTITIAVILVPLLLAYRRRTSPGAATALVTIVALFPLITHEFPLVQTTGAVGAIVGAAVADLLLVQLDHWRGLDAPLRLSVAGAVVAALVSAGNVAGISLRADITWPVELWTGVVVVTAAVGAILGGLATRPSVTSPLP